LIQSKKEVKSQ